MPGKIAADMMPLMTEPEIYSDLVLVVCYHEAYFNKELAWLTACSDLTKPGFQAHNMAVRYAVKRFLADLYVAWRTLEGLPVATEYSVGKLGIVHRVAA